MTRLRCLAPAAAMLLASALACASLPRVPRTPPAWSTALELTNLAAVPARFARPFREPVALLEGEVRSDATDCATLLAARARGASPASDRDLAIERDEGATCIALEQLAHARPVPAQVLARSDLLRAKASQLPPTLATPFGKRDDRHARDAEARGQTLAQYLPGVRVHATSGRLVLAGDTWEASVEVLARADFDASGRDELLLVARDRATAGTFENTRLLLVTRRADGTLATLKRLQ